MEQAPHGQLRVVAQVILVACGILHGLNVLLKKPLLNAKVNYWVCLAAGMAAIYLIIWYLISRFVVQSSLVQNTMEDIKEHV